MVRLLAVLLYPAGLIVILGAGAVLARGTAPTVAWSVPPRSRIDRWTPTAAAGGPATIRSVARFLLVIIAGTIVVYAVMALLGLLVVHAGPSIDKPVFHWTVAHREHAWIAVMKRATKVGDSWTTWAAAATAAVCLAVTWRRKRWMPPVALAALIVIDKYLKRALVNTFHRAAPPGSHGTFPSGGSDRAIAIYGLIAYLLWREFSGRRRTAVWAGAVVAALGFEEGYSRAYLAVHWVTDVLSGWIFGCLLLAVFIAAVRLVAGPATAPAAVADIESVAVPSVGVPHREAPA
jgi:membrane-associated phospholipid phosphatase